MAEPEEEKRRATLYDVIDELKENREVEQETAKNTAMLVEEMKRSRGDDLEDKLKKSRGKKGGPTQSQGLLGNIADKGLFGGVGLSLFSGIGSIFGTITKMVSGIVASFVSFGSKLKLLGRVAGRLFLPVTLAIGAIEGITAGWEDFQKGNYWDAAEKAVKGFFDSIVAIPLDLIKDGAAWLLEKMGFDETAKIVSDFSFSDLFDSVITKLFDGLQNAVDVVKDLFTFGEEDKTALGLLGKLTDLVYAPVNLAINYVSGLFGWKSNGEPFKLQDFIQEKYNDLVSWFGGIFSWAGEGIAEGWTNLTDYVSGKWTDVKDWFSSKISWAGDTIDKTWTSLTDFFKGKWQQVKDFVNEKLDIATDLLPDINIIQILGDLYEKIKFNFMSSMEGLAIWFMTMPQKIGLALETEWAIAVGQLKAGFVKFASWVAGIPDAMIQVGIEKVSGILGERLTRLTGLDTALEGVTASRMERDANTAASLSRIDYETAERLGRINERSAELERQQQILMDARQYVTNNNSQSQAIVMADGAAPTDTTNGGARFAIIGGP